jgi:hypothetical protein
MIKELSAIDFVANIGYFMPYYKNTIGTYQKTLSDTIYLDFGTKT